MPDIRDRFVRNIGPVVEPPRQTNRWSPMIAAALPCQFVSKLFPVEASFVQRWPRPAKT
jgi:hypothetical protein